ncbi:hypothetical protein [Actinospica sp.]|jgi:hypothetical protein|uniref:hypothetical protein n=1 Tax=Actinospica sp. TaxID=1872142 RepID=UPI002C69F6AF|nr:hypothetical protein [Actinospica sp.]HWG24948.1 hypothetical protein [Actinospica sp.]
MAGCHAELPLRWPELRTPSGEWLREAPIQTQRPHLDQSRVAHWMAHLDDAPAVVIFDDGSRLILADGHHRVEAARRVGRSAIRADIRARTMQDALRFVDRSERARWSAVASDEQA